MATTYTAVNTKLAPFDEAVLRALEEKERLTRSDIVRRALRCYAEQLGVMPEKPRRRTRKPQK